MGGGGGGEGRGVRGVRGATGKEVEEAAGGLRMDAGGDAMVGAGRVVGQHAGRGDAGRGRRFIPAGRQEGRGMRVKEPAMMLQSSVLRTVLWMAVSGRMPQLGLGDVEDGGRERKRKGWLHGEGDGAGVHGMSQQYADEREIEDEGERRRAVHRRIRSAATSAVATSCGQLFAPWAAASHITEARASAASADVSGRTTAPVRRRASGQAEGGAMACAAALHELVSRLPGLPEEERRLLVRAVGVKGDGERVGCQCK